MMQAASVTAALLVIGDEILSGRTKDQNIGYIADYLAKIGIDLREVRVVPDVTAEIVAAVNALRARYDYLFTTGGIGPTHDDITADAKKLSTGTVKGISLPADAARFDAFLFGYGGQVLSSDKTKAVFNDQKAQDALTFYSSFQLKDHSSDLPDKLGATWPGDAFGKQKAAMVIEGGWLIPYMHDTYPTVSYGSIKLPKFPVKQSSLLFTNGWGCSAKTKNPDACMIFVKYMTGKVVQQQVLQSGFALPSRKDLGNDPAITANPDVKNLFDSATFATAWTFGPHESKINDAQNAALQAVLLGKSDVKTALDKAEADATTALTGG